MPNNSYLRSVKKERQLVNEYRSMGWMACRSAGSKSPYDVWAVLPDDGAVRLIQVKTQKGGRTCVKKLIKRYKDVEEWLYTWRN